MKKRNFYKGFSALMLVACSCLTTTAFAGEIYGRIGLNGKVYANARVIIQCPGFSDTRSSSSNGAYRSPGPGGEQSCTIGVDGVGNTVPIITSQGRTRVNLEVKGGRLYRR